MCGAPTQSDASRCEHCGARLATLACPECFGMIFLGSKFCPRCGAPANRTEAVEPTDWSCPRCQEPLRGVIVGGVALQECSRCQGLWVQKAAFEAVCARQEQQAAALGGGSGGSASPIEAAASIRYIPCPECGRLMNRINFASYSGVIVDVCKSHGLWFDRDELGKVVEFIRGGGLDRARQRQKEELQDEQRRLERMRRGLAPEAWGPESDLRAPALFTMSSLLRAVFKSGMS
jgi:Zn-finger nucleic acid-binding protein